MAYNPRDHYFKKAKAQKFVARSIFKLEEIDHKLHVLKPGQRVLDLGAAPGSWSQYAAKVLGPKGFILGVDLKPISVRLANARFEVGNILEMDMASRLQDGAVDVVLSDMAPSTTGIKSIDQAKSLELCQMALQVARTHLKPHGHFVCKLFHSGEFEAFRSDMRAAFDKVEVVRPDSTRRSSREIFLVGLKKK